MSGVKTHQVRCQYKDATGRTRTGIEFVQARDTSEARRVIQQRYQGASDISVHEVRGG